MFKFARNILAFFGLLVFLTLAINPRTIPAFLYWVDWWLVVGDNAAVVTVECWRVKCWQNNLEQ